MQIIWTEPACQDFYTICDYIEERNLGAAGMVGEALFQSVEKLLQFPMCGRPGRVAHTRELVVPDLPYIVVYQVNPPEIVLLRVVHGAQDIRHWSENLTDKPPEDNF